MSDPDPDRSAAGRTAAELALVRICHYYGGRPGFVLVGGLVPGLLCSDATRQHAGTSDVDVQVDLEIAGGATNAARLEYALRRAQFRPDAERRWRWRSDLDEGPVTVVKFELLADREDAPQGATVSFEGSSHLGAANLRGTGFAARDTEVHTLRAVEDGSPLEAQVNVTGLAGFLLTKTAAAHGRHKAKDYYDIAFVLLHHDEPVEDAAAHVLRRFDLPASMRTPLLDLQANFVAADSPGAEAYARQMTQDNPDVDPDEAATDATLAVSRFAATLLDNAAR